MIQLRPYQRAAIDAGNAYTGRAGIIALPTGAGKSIVIAEMVRHALDNGQRVLNAIHNGELVRQNGAAIERVTGRKVGIVSATVGRKDHSRDAVVCSVGSAYRTVQTFGRFDLVIIDECHLVRPDAKTMYGKLLDGVRANNGDMVLIGQTATPWRMDGPLVGAGLWQDIIYDGCTTDALAGMVRDGYLSPLTQGPVRMIDLTGVRTGADGDYREDDSGHRVEPVLPDLVRDILADSQGRRKGLVFCPTVRTAEIAVDLLLAAGETASLVTGATPKAERAQIINAFRAGTGGRWLVSVSALTTGFDVPDVDAVAILRPTKSSALHVQMLGRGTRVADGKADCLVLDYVGNVGRCGPIDDPIIPPRKESGGGPAPQRTCPMCEQICHASAKSCPTCGHAFEVERKAETVLANDLPPMASVPSRILSGPVPTILPVTHNSRVVIDKQGRLWCRVSWADKVSILVSSRWATLLGLSGTPQKMCEQVEARGTKVATGIIAAAGEYARLTPGHGTASLTDLYWPVTTTPQLRGIVRRLVLDIPVEKSTITRACTAAGVPCKFGQALPGIADVIRDRLAKSGPVTIETFDNWVKSLTER